MQTDITSSIDLVSNGFRLDAAYHTSEGVKSIRFLNNWLLHNSNSEPKRKFDKLGDISTMFIGDWLKRIYVDDPQHGAPYLSGDTMRRQNPLEGEKFLSLLHGDYIDQLALKERMIIMTCSGTIGNLLYVNSTFRDAVGSPDLLRIIANNEKILPGYLYTFLSSKVGQALIKQGIYGGVIQHIEIPYLNSIPIPRLSFGKEELIHELIEKASNLWVKANDYFEQARAPFNYLIGKEAESYFPHKFDITTTKLSDLNDRFGGHYHSSFYKIVEQRIRNGKHIELNDLAKKIFAPPMFKHIYLNCVNNYPFITGGQLINRQITDVKYLSKVGVGNIEDYVVNKDWVVVYRHGQFDSMLGTAFMIDDQLDHFCLSDLVIRIIVDKNKIQPQYVYAFLGTKVGKMLLKRLATGRSIPFITEDSLSKIPIPILDDKTMANISSLITLAIDNRMASLHAENEAKEILLSEFSLGGGNAFTKLGS